MAVSVKEAVLAVMEASSKMVKLPKSMGFTENFLVSDHEFHVPTGKKGRGDPHPYTCARELTACPPALLTLV